MRNWKRGAILGVSLLALSAVASRSAVQAPVSAPAASPSLALPEPPQQQRPWAPPKSALPKELIAATGTLFAQGLADPRGCEYRTLEITTGDSTGGPGEKTRTRGWVLPATGGEQRFAVCWNGLVYPALSVGTPADLRRDVLAVVEPVERKRKGAPAGVFEVGTGWALGESSAVAATMADRLRTCLLLRLGEEELARRVWLACAEQPVRHDKGPYLDLATDWLWYLFDRTIGAHVRGDDSLALAGAKLLVRAQAAVEAEAARQGYERPNDRAPEPGNEKPPYIDFGTDPSELLADQEQRAAGRSSAPPANPAGKDASPPETRITALIQALNEVSERQFGQPGGVYLPSSPTIQALVKEGDQAVLPLIDCLENSPSLTRSVHYWRDFARHRQVIPVRSAAYAALTEILKTTSFGAEPNSGENDGRKLAGRIRAYWNRYQNLPRIERWYQVLQDDAAAPEQWLEAAANITLPADMEGQPGVMSPLSRSFGRAGRGRWMKVGVKGEALRRKTPLSVTSLLERRAAQVATGTKVDDSLRSSTAVDLALCLAAWDPAAALPTLQREFRRCEADSRKKENFPGGFDPDNNAWYLAEITLARARGKDPNALSDYTRWLPATPPVFPFEPQGIFEPLWRYPDDPTVITSAKTLFNAPGSAWRREVEKRASTELGGRSFVCTPLLGVSAFRLLVHRLLNDHASAGTASLSREGQLEVKTHGGGMSSSRGGSIHHPLAPKPGVSVPFRKCDLVAWSISQIGGAPPIQLYWPARNRDAAVGQISRFVDQYSSRLKYSDFQDELDDLSSDAATALTYPVLGRPATPADVQQTRAIFSLAGQGTVRVIPLPKRPIRGRWTTLRKYPFDTQEWDEKTGKPKTTIDYDQDGWVWQAEEVLVNGQWKRFYGFVGPHEVAKAPAEAIEFPNYPYGWNKWGELTRGLDCRMKLPGDPPDR